ncbi:MAG TPA: hypothetical protein VFU60_15870 [Ktedonobacterales bacterium]|nr:hypothetical protein [Ktedonobacterales bacterium]
MVRADNKPDINGPHYYSQYWIDVAMGKPSAAAVAATPASLEADEEDEDELDFAPKAAEPQSKASKPVEKKPDTSRSTLTSLADLANIDMLMRNSAEMDDTVTPDITAGIGEHLPPSVPGLDYDVETDSAADEPETATASQDEDFSDYDEEEDEDEDWGASRRRKPGKTKRRETHHDF